MRQSGMTPENGALEVIPRLLFPTARKKLAQKLSMVLDLSETVNHE